jgi:WD40 repeat protein
MRLVVIMVLLLPGCVQDVHPLRQLSAESVHATAVAWSGDSKVIAWGAEDGIVRVCDVTTGRELARTDGYVPHMYHYEPTGLALSPDGRWAAYGAAGGIVRLWDWRSGRIVEMSGHPRQILLASFSPDGQRLVTASGGLAYAPATAPATALGTSGSSRARRDRYRDPRIHRITIIVFDVPTGQVMSHIDPGTLANIAISSNGQYFAGMWLDMPSATTWPIAMSNFNPRGVRLHIGQIDTGRVIHDLPVHAWGAQFSPGGALLLSHNTVWDVASAQHIREVERGPRVFLNDRELLIVQPTAQMSLWPVALSPTRAKLSRMDLRTGWTRAIGEFKPHSERDAFSSLGAFTQMFESPALLSPDRTLGVNRQMTMWKVPQ